jgi:hypothetical protein
VWESRRWRRRRESWLMSRGNGSGGFLENAFAMSLFSCFLLVRTPGGAVVEKLGCRMHKSSLDWKPRKKKRVAIHNLVWERAKNEAELIIAMHFPQVALH